MKKIVILANVVWTIANFRKYLIQDLIKEGYDVYCIADIDDFSLKSTKQLKSYGAKFISIKMNRKSINPLFELLYMIRLFLILKRLSPDIILSYTIKPNIFGSFVARVLNIPQIATINGLGSALLKNSWISKLSLLLYKFALQYPSNVLFQNIDDLSQFIDKKILLKEKVLYVPGSGIKISDFSDCTRNTKDNKTIFLLVARLIADKGIYEYIQAAQYIIATKQYNCEFLLAGHFDKGNPTAIKSTEVTQWVNDGTIRFLGKTDNITDFFIQADVIVLPSYREGLSRLLLEAASCQKPLITTNVPGCKELVVDNINGFSCEPKDAGSLIDAMKKTLALSISSRNNFGINSRNIVVDNFAHTKVNSVYLKSIKSIFSKGQ